MPALNGIFLEQRDFSSASVNLASGSASLLFDPELIDEQKIIGNIRNLGYGAELTLDANDRNALYENQKREGKQSSPNFYSIGGYELSAFTRDDTYAIRIRWFYS